MTRRRLLVQVVTVSVVILIVILGDNVVKSDPLPAPDARSYIQNRPVYSKPSPKPRLALKLPSQLLLKENTTPQASKPAEDVDDVERITQTVYGFLDFVTTIGNTVMVFTPQTKKVEAVNVEVKPTLSSTVASVVKATPIPTLPPPPQEEEENAATTAKTTTQQKRQPKQFLPEPPTIEASEVELEQEVTAVQAPPLETFNTVVGRQEVKPIKAPAVVATPVPIVVEPEIRTQVNVVASAPNLGSGEFIEGGDFPSSGEQQEQEEDDVPQVVVENQSTTTTTTTAPTTTTSTTPKPQSKSNKHGFTLKLTPKHNSPVIITPAFSVPVVVTAQKVDTPPPVVASSSSVALQPTGLLNKIYETKVDKAGATTVLETAIIGTYIGTQYVRLLETTSSVLPIVAPQPTKAFQFPSLVKPTALAQQKVSTTTTTTSTPHTPDQDDEFEQDDQDTEEQPQPDQDDQDSVALVQGEREEEQTNKQSTSTTATPVLHLEPTPTASEEQTHYILPQKAEKIYVSPVPSPNAYSRGPGLYVDINPAKSAGDGGVAVVTATPTRGKQFRLTSNRFNPRNAKNQGGSDSNELTHQEVVAVPAQPDSSDSSRSRSRFGRNRGRSSSGGKNVEDVAVSTVVVSATPTRRFKSGRSSASVVTPAPPPPAQSSGRSKDFSSYKSGRGFTPSSRGGQQQQQNQQVNPTSSTSIYRFKLNRPTGRWRFKPSPKPKVNIIKTKEGEDQQENDEGGDQGASPGPIYHNSQSYSEQQGGELQTPEETRTESNELVQELEPELVPQTIRVNTVTPTDFTDLEKYLEIATIRSPYVFQAGNVKNTRYITVTKTFTKEVIQPTLASSQAEASLENILATKPPYEKILEGSSDVATLPVIALGGDMATPPLETITQSFSTTQLMLKTSILPVLYDGVTTLYTLTQSYFITRLVTAHKTVPPVELFQFVPTKSLNEFNTALQEAGSEHREHLLGSESEDENDTNYEHIIAPPDELTSVGSDFDPSSMDEKLPKRPPKSSKEFSPRGGKSSSEIVSTSPNNNPFLNQSPPNFNSIPQDPLASIAGLTPEQLAFIRYFTAQNQQQQPQPQAFPQLQQQQQFNPFQQQQQQAPLLPPSAPSPLIQAQQAVANGYSLTSSPVVVDTLATVTETKTLRLLFGAKPTHTVLYSTRVVPTRMTSYVTASLPVKPTQAIIQNNPFLNGLPFPLAYVG